MSFSLDVYTVSLSSDLTSVWVEALSRHGLLVEPVSGFAFHTWRGGFAPFGLTITPGAFPAAERYGAAPIEAGFEIDVSTADAEDLAELVAEVEEGIASRVRATQRVVAFSSPASRSVADLRLQGFAAAALADVAAGVLYDPQEGTFTTGPDAYAAAAREAAAYERDAAPASWQLRPFAGRS